MDTSHLRAAYLLDCKLQAMQRGLVTAINPVFLADISFKSPGGQLPFLLVEPPCSSGQIWDAEEGDEGEDNLDGMVINI